MTIHHDKLAYGKLASMREDFSEDSLIKMAQALSETDETTEKFFQKKAKEFLRELIFDSYIGMLTETGGKTELFQDAVINKFKEEYENNCATEEYRRCLRVELEAEIITAQVESGWRYNQIYLDFLDSLQVVILNAGE